MCRVIVFGGTTEGRRLAAFLLEHQIKTCVCVATAYGASLLTAAKDEAELLTVLDRRMDQQEMEALFAAQQPEVVVDATHPYATAVTANIRAAAKRAQVDYLRLLRQTETTATILEKNDTDLVWVDSVDAAVDWLADKKGRILATTGSKDLAVYTRLPDYQARVVARVLSTAESVAACAAIGFSGKNLICMQGPFSRAMDEAMLREFDCRYMVTKASGTIGGFEEKIAAAAAVGATVLVVGRPQGEEEEGGLSFAQCRLKLRERLHLPLQQQVSLVGIGMGGGLSMTGEARKAIDEAELLIGAGRMLKSVETGGKAVFQAYDSAEISTYITSHKEYERIAVLLSGDIGFFSGAKKLTACLRKAGMAVKTVSGVSSLSYFMGKLGMAWDDAVIVSNHGTDTALLPLIRDHEKVFSIMGKRTDVAALAAALTAFRLDHVKLYVGERLSYPEEKITAATAEEFLHYENDPLCVVCAINPHWMQTRVNPLTHLRDAEMIRGKVPMTKEEVRILSVSRLGLTAEAICYDVGAGTGSVSVEMACRAVRGKVYAIERKPEAVALIEENRRKFRTDNLVIVAGTAPEAIAQLPAPTHVFIGGSAGNMEAIVVAALQKNPAARFVINCIALESLSEALACGKKYGKEEPEISQIAVSHTRQLGGYTMMNGENPIFIISFDGRGTAAGQHATDVPEEGEGDAR